MSLAVLDFVNLSRDSADTYLSQGLADELSTRLGQVARLTVTSRTAVRRLPNAATMAVPAVGRALRAAYLVNGSYSRSGARLRFTVELLRATTGAQVWSSQYDRSDQDLLALQEAVATAVATAVAGRLLPVERSTLAARPTRNAEAYDIYLRARYLYRHDPTRAQYLEAVSLFERALGLDSSFAVAWADLANTDLRMFWFYIDRSNERLEQARVATDRAAAIAPDAAETHVARGYFYYWGHRDYGRALQEFSAALVARPNDADVHSALANVARRQASWDQSLASRTRSLELDPENRNEHFERALTYQTMRSFTEAERDYEQALVPPGEDVDAHVFAASLALERDGSLDRVQPNLAYVAAHVAYAIGQSFHDPAVYLPVWRSAGPHQDAVLRAALPAAPQARALHYLIVGQVLGAQSRGEAAAAYDSVRAIVEGLIASRPDDDGFHTQLAYAYAGLGRCDDALRAIARATELMPVSKDALTGPQRLQSQAEIEVACARPDQALDHIAALLAMPSFVTKPMLRADPAFAPLHGNARFQQLVSGN